MNCVDYFGFFAITISAIGVTLSIGEVAAFAAIMIFATAYATNREFRNAINQVIGMMIDGAIAGIKSFAHAISKVVEKAKNAKKYSSNEKHHIVAVKDARADGSRRILKDVGLNTSSQYNIVSIRKTLHKHLHTNLYHDSVFDLLKSIQKTSKDVKLQKKRIIAGLVFIGTVLTIVGKKI